MVEKIKKHLGVTLVSIAGFAIAILGVVGMLGMSPANNAFASSATTVVVTATVSEWLTFTADKTAVTISPALVDTAGALATGTSDVVTFTSGTNAGGGFSITVADTAGSLAYGATGTIASHSAGSTTLAVGADYYGIQASSTVLTVAAIYNYWDEATIGVASSTAQTLSSTSSPASGVITGVRFKAATSALKPAGSYTDSVEFTMTGAS